MARPQRAHSGSNRGIHLTTIEQHCIPGRGTVRIVEAPFTTAALADYCRTPVMLDGTRVRILRVEGSCKSDLYRKGDRLGLLVRPLYHISTKGNAHVRTLLAHKLRMHCSVTQTMA
jgi:hypothetical protein